MNTSIWATNQGPGSDGDKSVPSWRKHERTPNRDKPDLPSAWQRISRQASGTRQRRRIGESVTRRDRKRQAAGPVCPNQDVALSQGRYTWRHNRVLQELASVISTAKGEIHPFSTSSTVFTTEGGVKKWHGGSITINTHRKGLLDGCDDWVVSADLPESERHPDVIRKTALRPDIVILSASTQQIIMVELTVP
ncbi:reverse transcriptase [Plakobranchus ocellatus]|uniref:Reverse transcriptase n=1 Tax=Plakobranchus ocellatus TaxID=259542 RepID=A0AAV4CBK0_9GAST|nr:reverse transcriptase [Plakobranchus ocellatus]